MDNKIENFFKVGYRILATETTEELQNLKFKDFFVPIGEARAMLKVLSKKGFISLKIRINLTLCSTDEPIIESADKSALSKYLLEQDGYSDFLFKDSYLEESEIKQLLKDICVSLSTKNSFPLKKSHAQMFERIAIGTHENIVDYPDVDAGATKESDGSIDAYENYYLVISNEKDFKDFVCSSKFSDVLGEMIRWKCQNCEAFISELWEKDREKYLSEFKTGNYKICKKCKALNYFRVYKSGKIKFLLKK